MGRTMSLAAGLVLTVACGGRSSEGAGAGGTSETSGAGGVSAGNAGSPSPAAAGSGTNTANGGSGGEPPRTERCEDSYYACCDRDDGHVFPSTCGANGRWLPCSGNTFHPTVERICMPDSVSVGDCVELQGLACEAGLECHNIRSCSTFCTCEDMGGGQLAWYCLDYAC